MTQIELIQIFQRMARTYSKRLFTLSEIAVLAGATRPAVAMTLIRAEKKGLVSRVGNWWINRLDPPKQEELAFALASPSYISFENALYHHGVISQSPLGSLNLAVRGRPRLIRSPLGSIRLIHLKPSLFFGYDANRIAYPEKAWLDLLYIRGRKGHRNILTEKVYFDRLNPRKVRFFERKFPSWVRDLNKNL